MRLRKARQRRSSSRLISLPPVERRGLLNSRQASSPGAQSTVCTQRCHACSPGRMAKCGLARPSIPPSNSCGFVVGSCPTFACNSQMHLDLLRDKSKVMPTAADPAAVTSAQIWHCAYSSLEEIAAFPNIHSLVIATFPDTDRSLTVLQQCTTLRTARFHGFAKAEVARFLSLTGVSIAHCPEPVVG